MVRYPRYGLMATSIASSDTQSQKGERKLRKKSNATWKTSFLKNLMDRANASKCACKVCWTLRMKYLEVAKANIDDLNKSLDHYKKMGRFVGKAKHGSTDSKPTSVQTGD